MSTSAFAALSVNPIFRSNMVLQRNTTVPVFGTATIVGNTVQVTSSVAAPRSVRYGMSAVGNLFSSCNVPSEGGTLTITQLPASLFQLDW